MFNFGVKYENISVDEIEKHINNGALLVDIRNESSFDEGHIKGAINIPIKSLPLRMNDLDKNKEILVICYIGGSSKMAAKLLTKSGFKVKNIVGGMKAWQGPIVTK